ncbi:MAG: FlgD immunoglobulin-like domain containing protein, partial [bacterium]|nr:FlgD immunoglobulin-like domain containing protein [bacterium]
YKIFYKTLFSGSWSEDLCLSPLGVYAGFPSIALSGSQPAVIWQDFRDGANQIYFKKYSTSGWGQDSAISQSAYGAFAPCLAGDQAGNLHAAWEDLRDGNFEIYYRRFSGLTQTWGTVVRLTKDPYYSRQPFLLCQNDSTVNLFWSDDRDGSYEIFQRKAVNNVWQPETTLTNFDGSASLNPSAAVDYLGNLHLVWSDFGVSYQAPDIFYMRGDYVKKSRADIQAGASMSSEKVSMLPARPNPLRDRTKISMTTAQSGWARVRVYNIAGQLVKELYQGQLAGGQHEFEWDARDGKGDRVSNGLYLTRAESAGSAVTGKIMVVR